MTTRSLPWTECEAAANVDGFRRDTAPTVDPDGATVTKWEDLFVMVHRDALRKLSAERLYTVVVLRRLRDNGSNDLCQRVSVLEELTGLKKDTLNRLLKPGGDLTEYVRQRTETSVDTDGYGNLVEDEKRRHVWLSSTPGDDEERWRLDLTRIRW